MKDCIRTISRQLKSARKETLTGRHSWHPSPSRSSSEAIMPGGKIRETSCWWSQSDPRSQRTCACCGEVGKKRRDTQGAVQFREERERPRWWTAGICCESWRCVHHQPRDIFKVGAEGRIVDFLLRTPALGRGTKESKGWADSPYRSPNNEAEAQGEQALLWAWCQLLCEVFSACFKESYTT